MEQERATRGSNAQAAASSSSGKLEARRVHVVATIVTYCRKSEGREWRAHAAAVRRRAWRAERAVAGGATLPVVHERLLERYAAGLRYVYGTEAEVLEYANAHHAPHPQLSRELLDAIEDSGVVVSLSADQRGDAGLGDTVPPLGVDGAPTLEKRWAAAPVTTSSR
jgi:hypothetical protein